MNNKRFYVTVIEWLSHTGVIEATDAVAAEAEALRLWSEKDECQIFEFDDSGIDGVQVEEITDRDGDP